MAIIKQNQVILANGEPIQNLGENPSPYRELLVALPEDPLDPDHAFQPYNVELPADSVAVIRIPHAMSSGATGQQGQVIPAGGSRIPDVIIPVLTATSTDLQPSMTNVMPLFDGTMVYSPVGWPADEAYVYLMVMNAGFAPARVRFMVYIEYTHSIIRNEYVSDEYYTLYPA